MPAYDGPTADDAARDPSLDPTAAGREQLARPLPAAVRARVVALAADALGAMPPEEVPASLRAFRAFTPRRRARLAATPLAAAIEAEPGFRTAVAARLREALPALASELRAGRVPPAAEPLDVAAAAYLLRDAGWTRVVTGAAAALADPGESAGGSGAGEADRLQARLVAVQAAARTDLDRVRTDLAAAKAEVAELRRTLHATREARRLAEDRATAAAGELAAARGAAAAEVASAESGARRSRQRLAESEAALETARRAVREGRVLADTRLRLLLDTVVEAAQGLRRELALPPASPAAARPADVVAAGLAVAAVGAGVTGVPGRARDADDPGVLDDLLALPQVHLVVDGYNVTKLGYGGLTLQAQRDRLVVGLGALAAGSGAEVTCCFDGAAVSAPVPTAGRRGVRVLFSLPGETADELIRRLVANEPPGRPVVVVSTDREVADGVRARGARPVPAAMLLRRLDRG